MNKYGISQVERRSADRLMLDDDCRVCGSIDLKVLPLGECAAFFRLLERIRGNGAPGAQDRELGQERLCENSVTNSLGIPSYELIDRLAKRKVQLKTAILRMD